MREQTAYYAARGQEALDKNVISALIDNYVNRRFSKENEATRALRTWGNAVQSGAIRTTAREAQHRILSTAFEAEQLGYRHKSDYIGDNIAMYDESIQTAIHSRDFVRENWDGLAKDGRPILAPKGLIRRVEPVEGEAGKGERSRTPSCG